jgi:cellulose synthase/poly-beta-1,6-N-acetylglucosamine synthase-like glycosyltransferase
MQRETTAVCIPLISSHIKFLKRSLEGIKNQTRQPDYIHISASSCSKKEEKEISAIVENLNMSIDVNVHVHTQPRLAGANRNCAAAAAVKAGATLLFFFDADDMMHPQRIDIIARHFEENKHITGILNRFIFGPKDKLHIDYGTIPWRPFTNTLHEHAFDFLKSSKLFKAHYLKPEIYRDATSSGMNFVACAAVTVRAEFWQKWPYDEEMRIGEDQNFNSRIIMEGLNLCYIPDDLSVYVTRGRTEFDCMCADCEKLRPIECVPAPVDINKLLETKDQLFKRLQYLEQVMKSLNSIDALSKSMNDVNERITELESRPTRSDSSQ